MLKSDMSCEHVVSFTLLQDCENSEFDSEFAVAFNWIEGIFDSDSPWTHVFLRNINRSNMCHLGLYKLSVPAPLRFDSFILLKFLANVSFMFLKRFDTTTPANNTNKKPIK